MSLTSLEKGMTFVNILLLAYINEHKCQKRNGLHNILDRWHFFAAVTESSKFVPFYLVVALICHWRDIVHYVTFPLPTVILPLNIFVNGDMFSFSLLFVKTSYASGVKWNILQARTVRTCNQSCATVINSFVGASQNMTSSFHVWYRYNLSAYCGSWAASQQDEHRGVNAITALENKLFPSSDFSC